jgi:hypothetical protein
MKTYAKYNFSVGREADCLGNKWHEVTDSKMKYTPSGLNEYVTIGGISVKARFCTIVYVFEK